MKPHPLKVFTERDTFLSCQSHSEIFFYIFYFFIFLFLWVEYPSCLYLVSPYCSVASTRTGIRHCVAVDKSVGYYAVAGGFMQWTGCWMGSIFHFFMLKQQLLL